MAEGEENAADPRSSELLRLYEAQFFGFTPQTCVMRVNSAFQDCLNEMLLVVESVFVRKLARDDDDEAAERLRVRTRDCTQKLFQFLQERFGKLSGRMETLLLASVLTVPDNVLLPEDESHRKYPQSREQLLKLESSIAELQESYQAEVYARQALLAELEEQREAQQQLDEMLRWMEEMQSAWKREGNGNLRDSFRLMTESVTELQNVMGKIRKRSKSLEV